MQRMDISYEHENKILENKILENKIIENKIARFSLKDSEKPMKTPHVQ